MSAARPSPLLAQMIAAAREAGAGLQEDFTRLAGLDVRRKTRSDFFSEADLRAEATVRRLLGAARPDYGFLGEEGGLVPGRDAGSTWIVDPLDGTTNFLMGIPIFAVNIALEQAGQVVAGVTYNPMLQEMFWAERGQGAYLNDEPIRVSRRTELADAVLAVGIPFQGKPRGEYFVREMARLTPRVAGIRRLGAGAVDLAYVAAGRFDAYWEQSVSVWDIAAGVVLVEEAGGIISDTAGRPLDLRGGTILGANPRIHAGLVEALQP